MVADEGVVTLDEALAHADATGSKGDHLAFKARVLAEADAATHFEFIFRAHDPSLTHTLATFFKWRGKAGERFLVEHVEAENGPRRLATALQILGAMRSKRAAPLARRLLGHESSVVRERACIVLGWVRNSRDLGRLAELQRSDPDPATRKWAATQQMHILDRHPKAETRVLGHLEEALGHEEDEAVQAMLVYTAGQVLKRRFSLKEDPDGEGFLGDVASAREKALVALRNRRKK